MNLAFLKSLYRANSQSAMRRRPTTRGKIRLAPEGLEDRIALATHSVSTFADLQFWATHSAPGDTIKVAAGDYCAGGVVNVTVQRLTILGAQTNKEPTMPGRTPAGPAESTVAGFDLQADKIEIEGFTIHNENSSDHFGDGITTEPNHSGYQILDNIFAGSQGAGINLRSNGVFESDIQHNWWDNTAPVVMGPVATVKLKPNVSDDGSGADQWDIRDFGADFGPLSNVKIGYNTFTNASINGSAVDLEGAYATHLTNIEINQNVFDHSNGVILWNAANSEIYDNTMTDYSGTGIWLRNFLDGVEVTDNDLYAAAGADDGIRIEDATLAQPTMVIHAATVQAPSEGPMIEVSHNSISGGGTVTNPANGEDGIDVVNAAVTCLTCIEYNTISHMGHDGIHLNNAGATTVNNNYITYAQFDGIYVDHSNGNTVRDNYSSYNVNAGINVDSSSGNLIERNHTDRNSYGIYANSATSGNTFFNNNASNDTVLDYRDSSNGSDTAGTNNFWTKNNGSTANPGGLIN